MHEAAADAGLQFPLSLASEGSCTIGGNLSTNAGGTAVLRYGNTRELALGLEVVLADGRVWNGLRGLRKDNTGYDLKQLFIGGEGTLGIVTAAVLKLFPAPAAQVTALAATADVDHAVQLLRYMKQALGDRLIGFELISDVALALSRKHHPDLPDPLPGHPWYVLMQADDTSAGNALAAHGRDGARRAPSKPGVARGRRAGAIAGPGGQALGAAREHQRGAAPRRPQHQARHLAAGVGDSRVPGGCGDGARKLRCLACASSCSGTWATATCTTTSRRPTEKPQPNSCATRPR